MIPEYRIQGYIGIHSDTGIKRYTVIQGYKDTRNQRYQDKLIHGYKEIRMQGYRDTGIQIYRNTEIQ